MFKVLVFFIIGFGLNVNAKDINLFELPDSPTLQSEENFLFSALKKNNKKVVLDLWASWCEPCKESLPKLVKLQKDHPQIQVILINEDNDKSDALDFLKAYPELKALNLVFDKKMQIAKKLRVEAIPSSFVFDENGKLIERLRGYHTDTLKKLQSALALPSK